MSLVKLTSEGEIRVMNRWARPDVYETWLALLRAGAYDRIVEAMNRAIDRMDVVRAQYVVCQSGDEWFPEYDDIWRVLWSDADVALSRKLAGQFVGLILWEVMQQREEDWAFHKVDKTIFGEFDLLEDIEVMEYFRVQDFPRPGRWRNALASQ